MKKITIEQIETLKEIYETGELRGDTERARDLFALSGIAVDTYTDKADTAKLMVQAYCALLKWTDKGREGKRQEAENRLDGHMAWKKFCWRWGDCLVRPTEKKDDIYYIDGKPIYVESKSGAGDWRIVPTDNLSDALEYIRREKGMIRWYNGYYDIFLPFDEFYCALASYNPKKGLATWFNSQIRPTETSGKYVLRNQCVTTSKKKMAFLVTLEEKSYNWYEFKHHKRLVRNNEIV